MVDWHVIFLCSTGLMVFVPVFPSKDVKFPATNDCCVTDVKANTFQSSRTQDFVTYRRRNESDVFPVSVLSILLRQNN